jgi:RHS repeat-associated protein
MNRLTEADATYAFISIGTKAVKYGYDAASNRTSMTDPQNLPTAYTYDGLNRLNSLAYNGQNPGFGFGYDALSRRTSLTRPNGVTTSYAYDSVSRLTSILHQLGSTTLDGATYTYDNAGNRTSKSDLRTSATSNYGYDNIYQLLQVTQGASTTETYTYDLVGNRLSSLGVSPYQYNSSNELQSIPAVSYTYDKNGNTLTKSDGTQYTWDYENRLKQVTLPASGGTVNFKYDPFGRRIQKSFTQGSTTTTTNYLYDGNNLLEEVDQSGNVLARYTQDDPIDQPLATLRGGTTSYYHQDGLGSVSSLSNSGGALANTYTYDSYGRLSASTGTFTNPFQYTGREFDSETGLYYLRARYYDPTAGRFLNEDPLGVGADDFNFYAYVGNDPVDWLDSWGYSRDTYVPDAGHHGGPHIDRYNPAGQNVGRYKPDGTPLKHKGKPSPAIPNSDEDKFKKAADKLKKTPEAECKQQQPKKFQSSDQPAYSVCIQMDDAGQCSRYWQFDPSGGAGRAIVPIPINPNVPFKLPEFGPGLTNAWQPI